MARPHQAASDEARARRAQEARARLARLAWLLDSSIRIPGTPYTIGLDPLIGLIPFVGDAAGVLLSSYIVREAAALGAPKSVLVRMALNVALEGLVGMVPLAGDIFDAAFKANQRNVRLLNAYLERPKPTRRTSQAFVAALVLGLIAFLVLTGALAVLLAQWIASLF